MRTSLILQDFEEKKKSQKKMLCVLLDPDKVNDEEGAKIAKELEAIGVDWLMVGGSLTKDLSISKLVSGIKANCSLPVVLFPGTPSQIVEEADALMLLSLISGRNAELLIGRHVEAAPLLHQSSLQVIPTGYMLIESGRMTTVNYISNTLPIPHHKPDIALCTALAGEMLGLRMVYMDGGSGAEHAISSEMIEAVSKELSIPLIIGGGIRTPQEAQRIWKAGADMIVVGTAFEQDKNNGFIEELVRVKSET
jgi:phosphoglycerol geranylgeranyltransferase